MTLQLAVCAVLFGIYESIWRRTHGGGPIKDWYKTYIKPWLKINERIFDWVLNYPLIFCIAFFDRGLVWWQALIATLVVWAFWDITFGMYMGIGNHPYPNDADKQEYSHQCPVVWILDAIFKDNHNPVWGRYGVAYDFCGMWLRHTYPLIPLLFIGFSPWILGLGLLIAINYCLNVWVLKWWDAEYISGFITGLLFVLL